LFGNRVESNHRGSGDQGSCSVERGQILKVLDKGGWEKLAGEIVLFDSM
jgi:hypothetical protein